MSSPRPVRSRLAAVAWAAWLPIVLVGVWWFASASSTLPYFPPLSEIVTSFRETWFGPGFVDAILPSMANWAAGVGLALVVGVALGTALALSRRLEQIVDPLLQFARALPVVALIPLSLVILGTGTEQKVLLIAFSALWPILLNTVDAIRSIHPEIWQTTRVYSVTRGNVFFRVLLPGAFPQISIGIRVSLSVSLVVMIASEIYASTQGIGFYVISAQQQFDTVAVWSGVILLGLIGYLVTVAYGRVEARILRWRRSAD
ncbi:MAG: ABC transporter permease [Leifsonia sp.]|uniref:ABC transporter permease n=1 Tax=Leifsonia sp. TaxID=1870902 RepID=UPI003F7DFB0F